MNTINTYLKSLDYSKYFKAVVEWNATARGGKHDFSDETLLLQKKLVQEEIDELELAIIQSDKVEVLDALCDIFVVGSYYYYLQAQGDIKDPSFFSILTPLSGIDYYTSLIFDFKTLDNGFMLTQDVCALLYQFDGFSSAGLNAVMESNDSKFPDVSVFGKQKNKREEKLKEECKAIEERSEGRYTDVKYSIRGNKVVFLDSNKKIMKPSSFKPVNLKLFC